MTIKRLLASPEFRAILRRVGTSIATLLVIAYLALFGLIMAERGQRGLPADPPSAAIDALGRTINFVLAHPETYYWHRENTSAYLLVASVLVNSAGLLLSALGLATLIGVPVGIAMALWRRLRGTTIILLLSVLAVSTPSFLLGMLLWIVNIEIYRRAGTAPLPMSGFGWDTHLVMPALVLAARPLAQIVQVTYVSMTDVFDQDYVRTAHSKGLRRRTVLVRHALRNALIPILTTLGTSLRFSLSSLPVVEYFFVWPGVGLTLLQAIDARNASFVTDLILSLGILFLFINLMLEVLYQLIDPRLRGAAEAASHADDQTPLRARLQDVASSLRSWLGDLADWLRGARRPALPGTRPVVQVTEPQPSSARRLIRSTLGNPAFTVGTALVLGFFALALFGEQFTRANPYETHGLMKVDGEIQVPPFAPTTSFPWGSDPVGRDVQALVLTGAKQTLALALFGMVARVALGTLLGMVAAWWRNGWFDKLIVGAVGVWAAFPATLFAMILIFALGIQQGMWVFVVALCVVGWGEIAQAVRGQVIALKTRQYVEGARAVGARAYEILLRHILPNLLPTLLVLAILEMGGVLMLLAELGFLNIFMGGGFKVEIGEVGRMMPVIFYFSDVPEWGALLANIRGWWRSYPWLAWYPGLLFFAAILAFNLWGEGLRGFLEVSRVNVSRLFNRFTVLFAGAMIVGLIWVLQSNTPLSLYAPAARQFDAPRVLQDIRVLASPELQGRSAGASGAKRAAEYIAARMKEIGLNYGTDNNSYISGFPCLTFRLTDAPRLEILDPRGNVASALDYRRDMVEYAFYSQVAADVAGPIVGVALGPDPGGDQGGPRDSTQAPIIGITSRDAYGLARLNLREKVIIVHESKMANVNPSSAAGVLVVTDDATKMEKRYEYVREASGFARAKTPSLYITPQTADGLLATAGSSFAKLKETEAALEAGKVSLTPEGARVHIVVQGGESLGNIETCYNVMGYISGTGSLMGSGERGLDSQVIMVGAYYDGLGMGPEGALYPGANDNASGVALMLELARLAKAAAYQPKKTLVFAAWVGGERWQSLSVKSLMNSKLGLNLLTVEAVLEVSGVGAGDGSEISLGQGTSYRLAQLFQGAANQLGYAVTARGRAPHFGLPMPPSLGGRSALSAYVSWDGSDRTAHTPRDTFETIDPAKLKQTGETTMLVLTVLSRETEY